MIWDKKSGYLQPGDIELIGILTDLLPKDRKVNVVDLGAGSGTTALSVLSVRYKNIYVLSADINKDCIQATFNNMVQYGFASNWGGFIGRSTKLLPPFDVDLLLGDATHDYASKQDELEYWFKFLRPGSLVWAHEYAGYANQIYPGVKLAIDEFIEQGRLETIDVKGYSWGGKFLK